MPSTERRQLTDIEKRRAEVFKRAWATKKADEKLNQGDAGEALDMSPSAFGQYINGKIPIGLEAAIALCGYLKVSAEDAELEPSLGGVRISANATTLSLTANQAVVSTPQRQLLIETLEAMSEDQLKATLMDALKVLEVPDQIEFLVSVLEDIREHVS